MSVQVGRAFVRLREIVATHKALARELDELERRLASHDTAIAGLVQAIRDLATPPRPNPKRRIGFIVDD